MLTCIKPRLVRRSHGDPPLPRASIGKTLALPAPESRRRPVETSRPRDQIFHAARGKQRAVRLKTLHSDVLRVSNDSPLAKSSGFFRFGLQPNGAYTCHRRERTAALRFALGLVDVRDAFFGHDMGHIIAVD